MTKAITLTIEYAYAYPAEEYLNSQYPSDGSTPPPVYVGFRQFDVVERYQNTFTDDASLSALSAFITKITGIPAATQKILKDNEPLEMKDPDCSLKKLGLQNGDTLTLQTLAFPGPYDYDRVLTPEAEDALIENYPPPAHITDLSSHTEKLHWAKWESNTADQQIYTGGGPLVLPLPPNEYAAYSFTQQYYNPANPETPTGDISVTKVISWNGLPGLLRSLTCYEDIYRQADAFTKEDNNPDSPKGERINQTEYCEWKAFPAAGNPNEISKIVLTCEGPEYWQQLFKVNENECVRRYRELTGIDTIEKEDLIASKDITTRGGITVKKGEYNFWNQYNTSDGIVHLNQQNNFLSAELNIAALSTQLQQEKDSQGNLKILEKALPLILSGQYGSAGRNSDPTIGFVCNWVARHPLGLRLTIEPPVALYFGLLNTTGWKVPEGTINDWVKCTRGDASKGQGLRYEIAPPEGCHHYVNEITIGGEPLRYGGQAARCMTVQLTGKASPFSAGVAPPVRPRSVIQTSLLRSDPISGEDVGKILDEEEAANANQPYTPHHVPSRVPLTSKSKSTDRKMGDKVKNVVFNTNPPPDSPAQAYEKIRACEREMILEVDDIQGDPLVGFNTSYSIILLFDIEDVGQTKQWLQEIVIPPITTTRQVLERHEHMNAFRGNRRSDRPDYTYLNISFSNEGLVLLTSEKCVKEFYAVGNSEAFVKELPNRSTLLGDPEVNTGEDGARDLWLFGGDRTPHMMVQIQADRAEACRELADFLKQAYLEFGCGTLVFRDVGKRREGEREKPKEQFGFHDGISNPNVRGMYRVGGEPDQVDYISKRYIDKSDRRWNFYSKPGTSLIWPGELILGQSKQRILQPETPDGTTPQPQFYWLPGDSNFTGPKWAKNGTFVVYRRLRQDVAGFWNHARAGAAAMNEQFGKNNAPADWDATKMAANFIGRWPSGCPIMLSPEKDVEDWGYNKVTQNAFNYATDTKPFPSAETSEPVEGVSTIPQDNIGGRCPMGAHVRKINPRDQGTDFGSDQDTLTHRVMRRGTPYGDFVAEKDKFIDDGKDRGLQFIAYMASIDMQFEFVIRFWANIDQEPVSMTSGTANDMVIGQTAYDDYERKLTTLELNDKGIPAVATTPATKDRWVYATGGGYFFMPSITALKDVLSQLHPGQPLEEKSSQPQPPTAGPSKEQPPIERVRGIGLIFGQRLREHGVMWAAQFAQMDPGVAAGVLGISLERAAELVKRAQEEDFDKD